MLLGFGFSIEPSLVFRSEKLFKVISLFDKNDPHALPLWKAAGKEYIDQVRGLGVPATDASCPYIVYITLSRLASIEAAPLNGLCCHACSTTHAALPNKCRQRFVFRVRFDKLYAVI